MMTDRCNEPVLARAIKKFIQSFALKKKNNTGASCRIWLRTFFFLFTLARLPIPTWLTYCTEVIEGQSTHSNEKKHYKKLSTLAIGMSQFSFLRLQKGSESAAAGSLWVKIQPRGRDWSG